MTPPTQWSAGEYGDHVVQQTEGDEPRFQLTAEVSDAKQWTLSNGEQAVTVVPKTSLTAAEQRADEQEAKADRWVAIANQANDNEERLTADKDRLQRERDKLRFEAMLHVQEIPLEPAAQNSWLKHEVDRLQRENERLREVLKDIADWARDAAYETSSPNQVQTGNKPNDDAQ